MARSPFDRVYECYSATNPMFLTHRNPVREISWQKIYLTVQRITEYRYENRFCRMAQRQLQDNSCLEIFQSEIECLASMISTVFFPLWFLSSSSEYTAVNVKQAYRGWFYLLLPPPNVFPSLLSSSSPGPLRQKLLYFAAFNFLSWINLVIFCEKGSTSLVQWNVDGTGEIMLYFNRTGVDHNKTRSTTEPTYVHSDKKIHPRSDFPFPGKKLGIATDFFISARGGLCMQ